VPGRYDTTANDEAAVTDPGTVNWYVAGTTTPVATFPLATGGDQLLPAPADYDGDGKADPAVIDTYNGIFWHAGQPRPANTTGNADTATITAAVYPYAIVANLVRLSVYARCRWDAAHQPPGFCTGVV
jgi:hypothetical protein